MLFVEVKTDAGLTGLGEGTLEGRADAVENELRWLEESYVGRDPSGTICVTSAGIILSSGRKMLARSPL
jgi:hypothetical protein